jgi:outer membrane protein assembly factor BamB
MQIFAAGTWPQWRGESRDGQVTDTPTWPDRLNADNLSQSWRIELGDGYSSPVVDLKRVYTVETKDKSREVVRAFDRASGQKIWEASWEGAMKVPFFARKNGSWVRSTPALYKGSLYVGGIRDVLVCIDAESGAINWTVDFKERHSTPGPAFGFVCSPLVDETGVYVQAGGGLVKVNCDTGAAIWRTLDDGGGMFGSAFSSPRFAHLYGKRQVLVQTRTTLAGVDPKTGSVLWKQEVPAFRGMNIIPPVPYGDAVFTSSYGGGTRMIDVAPAQNGQPWSATQRWQATLQGYMSSPIVIGKHVYWHLKNQRIACYNLETGEEAWRTSESFGKYMSMAVNGDRVLALDQGGDLFLMNLTPDALTVVDKFKVTKSDSWAHVATCGDEIFIREQRAIAAYRWRPLTDAPLGARAAE